MRADGRDARAPASSARRTATTRDDDARRRVAGRRRARALARDARTDSVDAATTRRVDARRRGRRGRGARGSGASVATSDALDARAVVVRERSARGDVDASRGISGERARGLIFKRSRTEERREATGERRRTDDDDARADEDAGSIARGAGVRDEQRVREREGEGVRRFSELSHGVASGVGANARVADARAHGARFDGVWEFRTSNDGSGCCRMCRRRCLG